MLIGVIFCLKKSSFPSINKPLKIYTCQSRPSLDTKNLLFCTEKELPSLNGPILRGL